MVLGGRFYISSGTVILTVVRITVPLDALYPSRLRGGNFKGRLNFYENLHYQKNNIY